MSASIAAADDSAHALDVPFQNSSWQLTPSLLVGLEHFHYAEGDQQPTVVLDSHTAILPTALLAAEVTSPRSRFYARASFGLKDGSMTYDGQTQAGTPVTGPTVGHMTDVDVIAGGRGRIANRLWLGGYLGVGHHTWVRDSRPLGVSGYLENYAWSYLPVGVVLDIAVARRVTVSVDASLQLAVQVDTHLDISDYPLSTTMQADPARVGLAADLGDKIQITGSYAITRELRILAVAGVEQFTIGDGPPTPLTYNGQPVTDSAGDALGLSEPYSKTTRYEFSAGASYTFF